MTVSSTLAARGATLANRSSAPLKFRVGQPTVAPGTLRIPKAPKGRLNFHLSLYYNDYLEVQVLPFQNMIGRSVVLQWHGPHATWTSTSQVPSTEQILSFRVPRLEVVDAIGSAVQVLYTVDGATASTPFTLTIDSQGADMPSPVFTPQNGQSPATVSFTTPAIGITAGVRWHAFDQEPWDSPVQNVRPGVNASFVIPAQVLNASRGRLVLISYSINRGYQEVPLSFSHVLRLQL